MEGLQNRIDSFLKAKRVKNPNKSSYVNVKWPHPPTYSATPEALAEAGFYFNPTYEDRDTVTCYVCEKNLGGWEEEDDPLDLHWSKCGTVCCWAMVRCGLRSDMGSDGSYIFPDKDRLPTSTTMERARLETFSVGNGWIHDKPKNHGANSLKMARSGFAFTPQEPDDDLATCLYCGVCLSGWDPEDDPLEEHRKRDQKSKLNCPFFSFTDSPAPSKPASKPKASKSRQSSRQRTTSSQHQDIVAPLKDDTDNESIASTSKTKGARGRSTSKKLNRSQSRTTLGDVAEDAEEAVAEEEEEQKKPKKKTGKGKKSLAATTKGRGRPKAAVQSEDDDVEMQEASPTEPVASQTQDVEPGQEDEAKSLKKSTRGRKATRAASVEVPAATSQNPTRGKKKQPTPVVEPEPEPTQDTAGEDEEPPKRVRGKTPAKTPKTTRKPSKSKAKPIAAPPEEPEIEEEEDDDLAAEAAAVEAIVLPSEPITRRQSNVSTRQPTARPSLGPKPTSKGEAKSTQSSQSLPVGEDEREPEAAASNNAAAEPPAPPKAKPADEDADMDELPPLYVPKRGGKAKAAATDLGSSTTKPRLPSDRTAQMPAVAAIDAKSVPEDPKPIQIIKSASLRSGSAAHSEVSDSDTSDARKPLTKRLSKAPARKPSAAKQRPIKQESVVEISSDDDSDKEKKTKSDSEAVKGHKPSSSAEKPQQHPDAMVVDSIPANSQDTVEIDMKSPPAPSPKRQKSRSPSPSLSVQPAPSLPIRTATPSQPIPARSPSPVRASPPNINDPFPVAATKEVVPVGQPDPHGQDINMTSPLAPKEQPASIEPPRTPPRQTPFTTNTVQPKTADADPLFYPPLSRLPFTRIASLTDAELDMTVEDWIRYQMELEYDKFRRDGEKELVRFKKAAEDVRKIIEGL